VSYGLPDPYVPTVRQSEPTLAELRGDQRLVTHVNNQYNDFEAGQLGNVSTNKKTRGLLSAGENHLDIFILTGHMISF
jgi:hypothetical protein